MTSFRTQVPVANKNFPFCNFNTHGTDYDEKNHHNLGEILQGYDHIESSPYMLKMKEEMYCQQLCISDLGQPEERGVVAPNKVVQAIRQRYHHNWMADKLMAASKIEDDATITTRYWQGFPVGFIAYDSDKAYVHNHVNIEIMYHPVENEVDEYRVVRFTIEPFSIKHDFAPIHESSENVTSSSGDEDNVSKLTSPAVATITNPIDSCNPEIPIDVDGPNAVNTRRHTDYYMVTDIAREPQPASGQVLFTYDVHWVENHYEQWSSRWDVYMSMDNAIPDRVHWYSFFNSMVVLTIFFGIILTAYLRRLRNAAKLAPIGERDEENVEEQHEDKTEPAMSRNAFWKSCFSQSKRQTWRLLHGDVFRPPRFALRLAVLCGTGSHLLCTCLAVLLFGIAGLWHPSRQPFMVLDMILVYAALGGIGGYVTEQKCQELGIKDHRQKLVSTLWTALGFPGLLYFFFLGVFVWGKERGSTWDVGTVTILSLLCLWSLLLVPMTFLGSWIGRRRIVPEFPVEVAEEPRAIPTKSCFMGYFCPIFAFLMNAVWPFGACFVELYFMLASIWMSYWHQPFQYLAIGFAMVVATCSLVNILSTYWQLCRENHQWWWCSFRNGASAGWFVWFYSAIFFQQIQPTGDLFVYYLYFGSITVLSIGLAIVLGYIGLSSSTLFNRAIYGMIVHSH